MDLQILINRVEFCPSRTRNVVIFAYKWNLKGD